MEEHFSVEGNLKCQEVDPERERRAKRLTPCIYPILVEASVAWWSLSSFGDERQEIAREWKSTHRWFEMYSLSTLFL